MNYKLMLRTLGRTLQLEALCLLPPLVTALLYREDDISLPGMAALTAVLLFSIMRVTASSYNPFIYFRF